MKKLEELGISPALWKSISDSGYDQETGDFNTRDTVCDSAGKVIVDWWNGETYGEVCPNAEANARLIAAAPKLYAKAWELVTAFDERVMTPGHVEALRAALAEAAGESEAK